MVHRAPSLAVPLAGTAITGTGAGTAAQCQATIDRLATQLEGRNVVLDVVRRLADACKTVTAAILRELIRAR